MTRMSGVEVKRAPWHVRVIYWFAKRNLGRVPEGMKIRAYDSRLLRHALRMDLYSEKPGALPAPFKRLAMLKTAMLVGCPF